MNPEATLEIVRALSEHRLTRSHSALYKARSAEKQVVQFETRINQEWKTLVRSLVEKGKIHVLTEQPLSRMENKRKLLGY